MNELHEIIKRLMFALGYNTKKELAKALKISPSDLNNRINSGSIRKLLIDHAIHESVNVDYILTGEADPKRNISEPQQSYNNKTSDLLIKTAAVLESPSSQRIIVKLARPRRERIGACTVYYPWQTI